MNFRNVSENEDFNSLVPCSDIPDIDFNLWKNTRPIPELGRFRTIILLSHSYVDFLV